jgi:hypothetical protein
MNPLSYMEDIYGHDHCEGVFQSVKTQLTRREQKWLRNRLYEFFLEIKHLYSIHICECQKYICILAEDHIGIRVTLYYDHSNFTKQTANLNLCIFHQVLPLDIIRDIREEWMS